ncbi:MAG TPA: GNAT family N-acetyltransferase, partial [Candidatus Limnocylindria bacterium]|nr:GNAT family N-acetyltransferase [Candidatus Limnocylindria bacterium]
MTLPAELTMREATLADLSGIAALRESVGWSVHEWALRAVIGQPHARCVVVTDGGGAMAAMGSGIVYGPIGFVGNMVVAETHRRRGLGSEVLTAIISFLEGAGCVRLELNATSEGRHLYERHGFATIGTSISATIGRDTPLGADATVEIRSAQTDEDLEALIAYDRPRFGGDRWALLQILSVDPAAQLLLA